MRQITNWHKDFPKSHRMPYNSLIHTTKPMTYDKLDILVRNVITLAEETKSSPQAIVAGLRGIAWNEEDGGQILQELENLKKVQDKNWRRYGE